MERYRYMAKINARLMKQHVPHANEGGRELFSLHPWSPSYLSVLQLHGQHQLVAMVGERFPVVPFGEECRAQIPMGTAFSCLVT